jgi:hypothetical protein
MPPGQRFSFCDPAVSTRLRQPIQLPNIFCGQLDTGGHSIVLLFIDPASASFNIQIAAGYSGQPGFEIVRIPKLIQAANTTFVA